MACASSSSNSPKSHLATSMCRLLSEAGEPGASLIEGRSSHRAWTGGASCAIAACETSFVDLSRTPSRAFSFRSNEKRYAAASTAKGSPAASKTLWLYARTTSFLASHWSVCILAISELSLRLLLRAVRRRQWSKRAWRAELPIQVLPSVIADGQLP